MTSDRARDANRRNAQGSTGPTSHEGKARSARNAQKHGLSAKRSGSHHDEESTHLADQIAGKLKPDPEISLMSKSVAETQFELERIRGVKLGLLESCEVALINSLTKSGNHCGFVEWNILSTIENLERYERRTLSKRKFLIRRLSELNVAAEKSLF